MVFLLASLSGASLGQTSVEARFALVIWNEDYPTKLGRLNNPHVDADNMAAALKKARFSVVVVHDQDKSQIAAAVSAFSERLLDAGPSAIGFFYYSGHGASAEVGGERHNYLVPSRTDVPSAKELAVRGVKLDQIIEDLSAAQVMAVFVVFDACRNTMPLADGDKAVGPAKGFVAVDRSSGLYVAFASADGQTTADDAIFSQELARNLAMPRTTADRAFTLANRAVSARRNSNRSPFVADGLRDDVCFMSCPAEVAAQEQEALALSDELRVFKAALDQASESGYTAYLTRYPNGQYKPVAERELASLRVARPATIACPLLGPFLIFFDWDKSSLSAEAMVTIDNAAQQSRSCKLQSVVVTGYTDTSGSHQYNLALSQRMAQSVADALAAKGIPAGLITSVGAGESDLLVRTADGVREPQNRRVSVTMTFD